LNGKRAKLLGGAAVSIAALTLGLLLYPPWPVSSPVRYVSVPAASAAPVPSPAVRPLPERLKIPRIKVDTSIEALGVTAAGNMDVPSAIQDVGWYKYGPYPGEAGSAVIAGHFGTLNGQRSVFSNLYKLKPGDVLAVTNTAGQTTSFVVREMRTYRETDSTDEIFTSGGGAQLHLITCAGSWNKAEKRFLKRLVVFADKTE
jgi:LPXTG-site transpeptidase (sortase) family protein